MKKILITIVATVMVCACIVGGTVAWLMDKTEAVTNTFVVGKIDIDLTESIDNTQPFKMIPGETISKDPIVTVKSGSEACWLFVKIDESTNPKFGDYLTYTIATGWTALGENPGVFYREVEAVTTQNDVTYPVLDGNIVTVKNTVTNDMTGQPTLTFTAYAIQKSGFDTAAAAWAEAESSATVTP